MKVICHLNNRDSIDGKESDTTQEPHCLHYYPARQPLKVSDRMINLLFPFSMSIS